MSSLPLQKQWSPGKKSTVVPAYATYSRNCLHTRGTDNTAEFRGRLLLFVQKYNLFGSFFE